MLDVGRGAGEPECQGDVVERSDHADTRLRYNGARRSLPSVTNVCEQWRSPWVCAPTIDAGR